MLAKPIGAATHVTAAIQSASRATGATFDYLLRTAYRESALDPTAKASTSSARGLYQFIESTWLATVKEEGARFGLGHFAAAIERTADGRHEVRDPALRAQILALRDDPRISSLMAGALTQRNNAELTAALGRPPTSGELYVAHFLGAKGARRLISLSEAQPESPAAAAFPDAARANRSIFFRGDGTMRSAAEVHAALTARHDRGPAPPVPAAALAAVSAEQQAAVTEAAGRPTRVVYEHPVIPGRSAFAPDEGTAFEALFRTGSAAPVSAAVRELWSKGGVAAQLADLARPVEDAVAARPGLELPGAEAEARGRRRRAIG